MAETKQAASLMSIEELKQKLGVSDAVFEGTKSKTGTLGEAAPRVPGHQSKSAFPMWKASHLS